MPSSSSSLLMEAPHRCSVMASHGLTPGDGRLVERLIQVDRVRVQYAAVGSPGTCVFRTMYRGGRRVVEHQRCPGLSFEQYFGSIVSGVDWDQAMGLLLLVLRNNCSETVAAQEGVIQGRY